MPTACELLTVKDVCKLLRLSRARVYAHVNAGRIPRPIHIAPRCPRWRRAALERWLAERERAA